MPRGLTERPIRDSAGLGRLAPCTRRQRGLPTRSLSVPRSRSPHPICSVQEANDGSKSCNAIGLAVLLSSVLTPAAVVAATRPLLEVAASPEVVSHQSGLFPSLDLVAACIECAQALQGTYCHRCSLCGSKQPFVAKIQPIAAAPQTAVPGSTCLVKLCCWSCSCTSML